MKLVLLIGRIKILRVKKFSLLLFLLLVSQKSVGQFKFGQHPLNLQWQELESPAINVIFPKGLESQATRIANIINFQRDSLTQSVGDKFNKIKMVLQNQTVQTNGFVALAPFRSEFFSTPGASMNIFGTINWLDLLTIHEYRHVLQNSNTRHGLTKIMSYIRGQVSWQIIQGLSVPDWYFEGDAVITETANSKAGRGRTPSFTNQMRALADTDIKYNYTKFRNGSFKDNVPSHYPIGYTMLTHLREQKGNNIMVPVLKDGSAFSTIIYPFSGAMKQYAGMSTRKLYDASMAEFKQEQEEKLNALILTETEVVTPKNEKTITNYVFPQYTEEGEIIAWKNSYKEIAKIVLNPGLKEKKIIHPGITLDNYFDYSSDKLVSTSYTQHPRRTNVTFSDVFLYDMKTGERKKLTINGKYHSPALSPDGSQIVVAHFDEFQKPTLRLIDVLTWEETEIYSLPIRDFITRPSFTSDGNSVIFLEMNGNDGISIKKMDLRTQNIIALTPRTNHVISTPRVNGDYVYYSASFNGIDNIYRSSIDGSKKIEQLTSVRIAANSPDISSDGNTLLFTEHTDRGSVISKINLSNARTEEISIIEPNKMKWQDDIASESEGGNILDREYKNEYYIGKYKSILRGLTLHTWGITSGGGSESFGSNGLVGTLEFSNYLDDLKLSLVGGYNSNEGSPIASASLSIGKWYPVIGIKGGYSNRNSHYLTSTKTIKTHSFNELTSGIDISFPFSWISGTTFTSLTVSSGVTHYSTSNRKSDANELPSIPSFQSLDTKLSFRINRQKAKQHLAARLGLSTSVSYKKNLNSSDNKKIVSYIALSLPGIFKNHSIEITSGYQKELLSNSYQYADIFAYPKGFQAPQNDEFMKLGVSYGLPLIYPDWGYGGIAYFSRIRANLFYEYGDGKNDIHDEIFDFQSTGVEIVSDTKLFNFIPISLGYRFSYLLTEDSNNPKNNTVRQFFFSLSM